MGAVPLIEPNPHIMMGKPVVAGTRITVELAAGESREETLKGSPPPDRCGGYRCAGLCRRGSAGGCGLSHARSGCVRFIAVQTVQTHGAEMARAFTVISTSAVRIRSKRSG